MSALHPLRPEQRDASDPQAHVWVSASAGTGKTQVLTARVLRLLLSGADPARILCLTFTKAAAAEMQTRIYQVLARWVRTADAALAEDLAALGQVATPDALRRARELFALTLEARGGLRIQTLHAFAQSLLASFPLEAGVPPGFEALDERSGAELRTRALAEALEEARANQDQGFIDDVAALAVRHGEQRVTSLIQVLLSQRAGLEAISDARGFEPMLRRHLGLPTEGARDDILAVTLADDAFDTAALRTMADGYIGWGTETGHKRAGLILDWLSFEPERRVVHFDSLCGAFLTAKGEPFSLQPKMQPFAALAETLCAALKAVSDIRALLDAAALAALHLRVGHRIAARYNAHKVRAGVLDFGDMIDRAAAMLTGDGMAAWVAYKLDQTLDHILVDEGQDTNDAQWRIVHALAEEFFAGLGQRGELIRTLFAVGDFKQAIFGFQGSDPKVFDAYRDTFGMLAEDAGSPLRDVPLAESFRSTDAVLDVVNQVLDDLGADGLGLREQAPPHRPAARLRGLPGEVTLWPAVLDPAQGGDDADDGQGQEWIAASETLMAQKLAKQIAQWLRDPPLLATTGRPMRPEDVLVLVRKRREFVGALVAALHAERVPVAGVDRLRLTEPVAVQDLLALIRFALQPADDLTLAALLTSPLIGLDQDALFALAHDRGSQSLWQRVREAGGEVANWLRTALGHADLLPPYEFLETVLSGPLQGRKRLLARLGEEARDGIDMVLAQALAFEQQHPPSLQRFLAWIEADDQPVKRDPEAPIDAVRIMTVHGAKGLQAPVVILADAARGESARGDGYVVDDVGEPSTRLPIFYGTREGRVGRISEAHDDQAGRDAAENMRLLYVALTRAEERLYVGGSLGKRQTAPPDDSWHALIGRALDAIGAVTQDDPLWETVTTYARAERWAERREPGKRAGEAVVTPAWATTAAPPEASPPRPLSPSQIAADDVAQPPPSAAMADAARRGQLLHGLFERLPEAAPDKRDAAARGWLARQAPDLDDAERAALTAQALGVIRDPRFAALFGPEALAEAPVAALVGKTVIAGTVDRLLVEQDRIQVVDFKTGSRVPASAGEAETYHLKQMAAYVAALERVFPGRRIEAALLYTQGAKLLLLPAELIDAHRPVEPDDSGA